MNVFNAAEAVDIAIEKEIKRRDFYRSVSGRFSDKPVKDLFSRLADWEDTHVRRFAEIRASIEEDEAFESFQGELRTFMIALVDEKLYSDLTSEHFSELVKTPLDAIRHGMVFEKDAILFFRELEPFIPEGSRGAIRTLIDEEKKHLIYLSDLKKSYGS